MVKTSEENITLDVAVHPISFSRPGDLSSSTPWFLASPLRRNQHNRSKRRKQRKREFRFIPSVPRETTLPLSSYPSFLHLSLFRQALLTLYTSICYAAALCAKLRSRRYIEAPHLPSSAPYPQAIFDQYYKNQPTDFLREILPPSAPEYFITVHRTYSLLCGLRCYPYKATPPCLCLTLFIFFTFSGYFPLQIFRFLHAPWYHLYVSYFTGVVR